MWPAGLRYGLCDRKNNKRLALSDLVGIVLMGGKSSRMGTDKSQLLFSLRYNSDDGRITQIDPESTNSEVLSSSFLPPKEKNAPITLTELAHTKLKCYVDEVYFSINKNQEDLGLKNTILDEYEVEGPLSGIISALRATKRAILVLGVDMPLITKQSIKNLIKHRNWDLLTTTYYQEETNTWEPMLSIWEYETLPCLEEYFESGGRSIQKFLNQYGNQRVPIINKSEFINVNTMEEYKNLSLS